MFLGILDFIVENKKKYLGETVWKMWSQIYKKNGLCVRKTTYGKKCKKKKKFKRKTMKTFKIFGGFVGQN